MVSTPVDDMVFKLMESVHGNSNSLNSINFLLRQISRAKFEHELDSQLIPLNNVNDWRRSPSDISHVDGKFFSVIGVRVSASNREVCSWDQPIIRQVDPGIIGFVIRDINNVTHFLVQLKMESGNMDLLELAATVQCITGSYKEERIPPYVQDMINCRRGKIVLDTIQSEEGGRFYLEGNRYVILYGSEEFPIEAQSGYLWMTLGQLKLFLNFNNYLNVQSRSLLAII